MVNTKTGALRAWYICMWNGNGQFPICGAVTPSKVWRRKKPEIGATGQKYYCPLCGTRYKTTYGMLVEIRAKEVSTFMRAEISSQDEEDLRAMYLEKTYSPEDAYALWMKTPNFKPMDPETILRAVRASEVLHPDPEIDVSLLFKFITPEVVAEIGQWKWATLLRILKPDSEQQH